MSHMIKLKVWVSVLGLLSGCETASVVGGECVFGLSACGNRCVDVSRDARHCGRCDRSCKTNERCRAGVCQDQGGPAWVRPVDGAVSSEPAADAGALPVTKD